MLPDFSVYEEMLEIEPLYRTTKGVDIFNLRKNVINKYIGFDELTALTTDGAKADWTYKRPMGAYEKRGSLLLVHSLHYPPGSSMCKILKINECNDGSCKNY